MDTIVSAVAKYSIETVVQLLNANVIDTFRCVEAHAQWIVVHKPLYELSLVFK